MVSTPENQPIRELTDVLEQLQSECGYLLDDGLDDGHDGDDSIDRIKHWVLEIEELWGRVKDGWEY